MTHEFDFYFEILGEFSKLEDNPNLKEAWKINSIIKLMNFAKQMDDNEQIVQTGLLIIMHLASGKYCDDIECYSRNLNELLENERNFIIDTLKTEFN